MSFIGPCSTLINVHIVLKCSWSGVTECQVSKRFQQGGQLLGYKEMILNRFKPIFGLLAFLTELLASEDLKKSKELNIDWSVWNEVGKDALIRVNPDIADNATEVEMEQDKKLSKCGQQKDPKNRISGGEEVAKNSLPWMVFFRRSFGIQDLSGTLISSKASLTCGV